MTRLGCAVLMLLSVAYGPCPSPLACNTPPLPPRAGRVLCHMHLPRDTPGWKRGGDHILRNHPPCVRLLTHAPGKQRAPNNPKALEPSGRGNTAAHRHAAAGLFSAPNVQQFHISTVPLRG
jgi:hypothetical protein